MPLTRSQFRRGVVDLYLVLCFVKQLSLSVQRDSFQQFAHDFNLIDFGFPASSVDLVYLSVSSLRKNWFSLVLVVF
jgi:hypothetical protein